MNLPEFFSFSEEAGLWGLLAASFISATILPGGSEVVLLALITKYPELTWQAVGVASIGNTLGGMSSYLIGRIIPQNKELHGLRTVQKYGSPALLLSWVPIIGDPLCVAAGWMRLNPWLSAFFMAAGKFARCLVVASVA